MAASSQRKGRASQDGLVGSFNRIWPELWRLMAGENSQRTMVEEFGLVKASKQEVPQIIGYGNHLRLFVNNKSFACYFSLFCVVIVADYRVFIWVSRFLYCYNICRFLSFFFTRL